MNTEHRSSPILFKRQGRRQKAQSMLEFALALPFLLMLVFGIIEFGRLLQAWLALENGARMSVRYAVTGSYDTQFCPAAATALGKRTQYPAETEDLNKNVITITKTYAQLDLLDGKADCVVPVKDGSNVITNVDEVNGELQDWARMPSIRNVALSGATGIARDLTESVSGNYNSYLTRAYETANFDKTYRGNPGAKGYFNISMCSSRLSAVGGKTHAFQFNPNLQYYDTIPAGADANQYAFPTYCQEVEAPSTIQRYVDDAGGPGDRVRIVLTYRHTLITPFVSNWWPTLRLTTEREGVVEKFRVSRVTGLTGPITSAATYTFTPPPTSTATATATPVFCTGTGGVLYEWWDNIGTGNAVSNLTSQTAIYPDYPTGWIDVNPRIEIPSIHAGKKDKYGTRFRGYVCPPMTGDYTFYIASDDNSELWLSTNPDNEDDKQKIASVTSWTNAYVWTQYASQKSAVKSLVAGQLYYIEALHKEGSGGDNMSVAWTGPYIGDSIQLIEDTYLKPYPVVHLPTKTPTVTPTRTATPPASCDMLQFTGSASYPTEYLDVGGNGIWVYLKNNSANYNAILTSASGTWDGGWRSQASYTPDTRATPLTLTSFNWYPSGGSFQVIDTIPDASRVTFNGNTSWSYNFKDYSIGTKKAGQFVPYFSRTFEQTGAIYDRNSMNFYQGSDFSVTLNYTIGGLSCSSTVSGFDGPTITQAVNNTGGRLSIEALVNNPHNLHNMDVYFSVWDMDNNKLVHESYEGSGPFCIFGDSGGTCATRQMYVDTWSNGVDKIENGRYRVSIVARDKSLVQYSHRIQFEINLTGGATPTNTLVPTRTRTSTNTAIPTATKSPTITRTPTNTPLPTNTPVPKTPTRTPTRTRTPTLPPTATPCNIPVEQGGCF